MGGCAGPDDDEAPQLGHGRARPAVMEARAHCISRSGDVIELAMEQYGSQPLEASLRDLTQRLRTDMPLDQRARLMNIAGDLCCQSGQRERALLYYDACIDLYVSISRFAASAAVCDKLVRLNPQVVRARCTLAWLAIARGLDDEALQRVVEYGEAALRLERPTVAQRQLRAMAQEVENEDVLEAIAHALLKLGDAASADRVLDMIRTPATRRRRAYDTAADRDRAIICHMTHG
jgi:tetratricopeptide (TPR) repeat protein